MYKRPQHRSSPIKEHVKTFTYYDSSDHDPFMDTGDSTRSLLAPLYSDTFPSGQFKELPNSKYDQPDAHNEDTLDESLLSQSISSIYSNNRPHPRNPRDSVSPTSSLPEESKCSQKDITNENYANENNISWEQWLLKKTIEDIENFNLKREKRKERSRDKKKLEEEKSTRIKKSVEQREKWVKKKDIERESKLKEKEAKIRSEKLKEEEEKRVIKEKEISKLCEWQDYKLQKEKEERKKLQEEKRKADEEFKQKKLTSEESYKTWLEKSKTKKLNRSTYGYSNGTLISYYDMGCSPAPSYKNPLPWVGVVQSSEEEKSKAQPFFSPPLLWKDVEKRDPRIKKQSKQKRVIVKHSCVGNVP